MTNTKTVEINPAFNGPPACGQGGYVSGVVAAAHGAAVCEVSLKAPIPLGKRLTISSNQDHSDLYSDDKLLVTAKEGALNLEIPPCPSDGDVAAAKLLYRGYGADAIFTRCFVCGTARHDHEAMRLFAGPLENSQTQGLHASHWLPDANHGDEKGTVRREFIWAALDCPGYFAGCQEGQLALLGRMTATIIGDIKVGEKTTVIAWPISASGRKAIVGTALYNETGDCIASAEGLWIHIDKSPFAT